MPISPNLLVFNVFLGVIWLYFFLRHAPTRLEMLTIGALAAVLTPLPFAPMSIFDLLFSFFFAGIAAVVFQQVLGRRYRRGKRDKSRRLEVKTQGWLLRLFLLAVIWAWLGILLIQFVGLDVWQGMIVSALLIGSYIIALRRDLLSDAFGSAVLMAIVFFLLYEISFFREVPEVSPAWWSLATLPEKFIASVPLSAIIWAAAMGFAFGPLYEFVRGWKLSGPKGNR